MNIDAHHLPHFVCREGKSSQSAQAGKEKPQVPKPPSQTTLLAGQEAEAAVDSGRQYLL